MIVKNSSIAKVMPRWAKETLEASKSSCADNRKQDWVCYGNRNDEHAVPYINKEIDQRMSLIALDETDKDQAAGEPGKVATDDKLLYFETDEGVTEFYEADSNGQSFAYGKVNHRKGSYSYLSMYHKDGQGEAYESFFAQEGALSGQVKDCIRGYAYRETRN